MGLDHREYHPVENDLISRGRSRYIIAHGPGSPPQGVGNSGVGRTRPDSFGVIYRTMRLDNAVQDTER